MKRLLILTLPLFLTACATTSVDTKHMTDVVVDSKTETLYAFPSDEAMKSCPELPVLKGKKTSDLYSFGVEVSEIYNNCAKSKDSLIESINNIKSKIHK